MSSLRPILQPPNFGGRICALEAAERELVCVPPPNLSSRPLKALIDPSERLQVAGPRPSANCFQLARARADSNRVDESEGELAPTGRPIEWLGIVVIVRRVLVSSRRRRRLFWAAHLSAIALVAENRRAQCQSSLARRQQKRQLIAIRVRRVREPSEQIELQFGPLEVCW